MPRASPGGRCDRRARGAHRRCRLRPVGASRQRRGAVTPGGSPSGTLWWMYLLVGVALAVAGAGAGQALFYVHDLGNMAAAQACLLDHGVRVSDGFPSTGQAAAAAAYELCAHAA